VRQLSQHRFCGVKRPAVRPATRRSAGAARIVQQGPPALLLAAAGGLFHELVHRQIG
jgi:hypothetical protein